MSSDQEWNSSGSSGLTRPGLALLIVLSMLVTSVPLMSLPASSDPWYSDDGDMTRNIQWNFTNPSDYSLNNTTISDEMGQLSFLNQTVGENSTADFELGTGSNLDTLTVPDAVLIDDTSLPVQMLRLQPGPEGKDTYLDEWFPSYTPKDTEGLRLCGQYDPDPMVSKRQRIIMELDLSLIPAGATIWNATLLIYETNGKGPILNYTIHSVNSSWVEEYPGVSWYMKDILHSWALVGGDYSLESFSSGTIDSSNGYHALDITRLVDLWTRGAIPNCGLLIVANKAAVDDSKYFSSCEDNKIAQRPVVYINYTQGSTSGSYQSSVLGQGLNSTFTTASWGQALVSKASDEFSGTLSSGWTWLSDPRVTGGSVSLATPGWLNITGSSSTNLSSGVNYLHQSIAGDFTFETSLVEHFNADSMGAGVMVRFDSQKWLALYKKGTQATGQIVAESRSGTYTTFATILWPYASACLRLERAGGTYTMSASTNGSVWTTVRTLTLPFDFPKRASVGLCIYAEYTAFRPVVEFDYARIEPPGMPTNLQVFLRAGNSTTVTDPSWTGWAGPLSPYSGASVNAISQFVQYRVEMNTSYEWFSPMFSSFESHFERYAESGTILTEEVTPVAFSSWQTLTANQTALNGAVEYSYSTDHGASWVHLGPGTTFNIPIAEPSLMIEISITTFDTRSTPSVEDINLQYVVTHIGFYVLAPSSVVAGTTFSVVVDAKDGANVTQPWTGPIALDARNASGDSSASAELAVTTGNVSNGHLVITTELYTVAETIRIAVSGGGSEGISDPVNVVPAAINHIHMGPNVTRLPEDNSSSFSAIGHDIYENVVVGPINWHADASLGLLNATSGPSVLLTVPMFATGGYLNVTIQSMTLSRYIEIAPLQTPPQIDPVLPIQIKPEDFGTWTLDISPYVSDREDSLAELRWYAVNETVVTVGGENRTGNMVITFTTILNLWGLNNLEIRVVDSSRMMAKSVLPINITPVNDDPVIDPIDPLVVRYESPYPYNLEYYVHDVETPLSRLIVTVDLTCAPYVAVDGLWITLTYPKSMNGTQQEVLFRVADEDGGTTDGVILVTVSDDYVPVTKKSLPDLVMNQGEIVISYFDLDDYFTDPDGDLVMYTYGNTHVTVGIQANNTVDFYAPFSWHGQEYIVFRANDSRGARAESAMVVTVVEINQPPVITDVPDVVVRYGREFTLDLSPYINDLDDAPEDLSVMTNDPHVWVDGLTLVFLYPMTMLGLKVPVNLTVSDGPLTDFWIMNVTVSSNTPPSIAISLPDFSFDEDEPVPYPAAGYVNSFFTDEDGDALIFYAFVSTPNMTATAVVANGNWTIIFDPEENWNGLTRLTIRAIDAGGAMVETSVELIVNSVPDRPVLQLPESLVVVQGVRAILDITKNIIDPDSSLADFRFVVDPEFAAYVTVHNGMIMFDFPYDYLGKDEKSRVVDISMTVFDQDNLFSSDSIKVTINSPNVVRSSNPILWIGLLASAAVASVLFVFVVVRRKKPFVVRDMMLIHNDGFLIGRQATPIAGEIDEQILSGMLTAVLNFVEDSMSRNGDTLTTFGFREYQVLVKRGERIFAAVVYQGDQPEGVGDKLNEFIKKLERIYKKKIADWTGDIETDFAGVDLLLKAWVAENSKAPRKGAAMPWRISGEKPPTEGQTAK